MKSITEKLVFNKNTKSKFSGYYNTSDLNIKYAIVYPNGFIELFENENTINDAIQKIQKDIDTVPDLQEIDITDMEDTINTYEELLKFTEVGKWSPLSGPVDRKSGIQGTYGVKFKK